jgi:SAM-dependent methyltransferase
MSAVKEAVLGALATPSGEVVGRMIPSQKESAAAGYRELLIGGKRPVKMIGRERERAFKNLDHVQWDGAGPLAFPDDAFDEVHCYHQLQRMGRQGDYVTFFAQVSELWRLLKHNGLLCLTVPSPFADWVWGDPGHTRCISMQTITYLTQTEYDKQLDVTAMVDYREWYRADFEPEFLQDDHRELRVILRAVKPSRCSV